MRQFRIGIDIDDVLIGTADCVTSLYNSRYGTNLSVADAYNLRDLSIWKAETPLEVNHRIVELMKSDGFKNVHPLPDSQRVLRKWKEIGHILYLITGRPNNMRGVTIQSISKLFPGIFNEDAYYFTDYYNHDNERSSKGDVVSELSLTHYIDDQADHVNDVVRDGVSVILFGDNHTRDQLEPTDSVIMVDTWQQVEKFIDKESRKL